jgi:proprotein convertase subtilisin/kexin type 5
MQCHIKCASCTEAEETACLSCSSTSFRTYNPITKTCDCNPGYLDLGLAVCSVCHSSCFTCYGLTEMNCSSCHPGTIKMGSTCRNQTTCIVGYNYEGYCVTVCPNSTYLSVNVCTACINNCKTCLSSTVCTSCVEGYFYNRSNQKCTVNCVQGFYIDNLTHACESCPLGCELCVSRNDTILCQKCTDNYLMLNHTSCVDADYCSSPNFVKMGFLCLACEHPCEACQTIAHNGCLSCK